MRRLSFASICSEHLRSFLLTGHRPDLTPIPDPRNDGITVRCRSGRKRPNRATALRGVVHSRTDRGDNQTGALAGSLPARWAHLRPRESLWTQAAVFRGASVSAAPSRADENVRRTLSDAATGAMAASAEEAIAGIEAINVAPTTGYSRSASSRIRLAPLAHRAYWFTPLRRLAPVSTPYRHPRPPTSKDFRSCRAQRSWGVECLHSARGQSPTTCRIEQGGCCHGRRARLASADCVVPDHPARGSAGRRPPRGRRDVPPKRIERPRARRCGQALEMSWRKAGARAWLPDGLQGITRRHASRPSGPPPVCGWPGRVAGTAKKVERGWFGSAGGGYGKPHCPVP